MLKIALSEIKYNWGFLTVLGLLTFAYTISCLFDYQIIKGSEFAVDYWGGIFAFFFYFLFYSFWITKIREQRLRVQYLLPLSFNSISLAMILFLQGVMIFITIYLVIVHYLLIDRWHDETGSLLLQIGLFFLSFQIFIIIRDLWFSTNINLIKYFNTTIVALSLAAYLYWFFTSGRLLFYDIWGWDFGRLSLLLTALISSLFLHFSFKRRRSFLS